MAHSEFAIGDRLPHACLISAPTRELALRRAGELAAAAVCSGEGKKPCGRCRDCRKAAAGVHSDIITVARLTDDKGRQKQNITVDQIRAVSADAIVLPNEAQRKVYIIDGAETMNAAAQNAALKLLEEPPAGVVFLLCTVNALLLLPTVRSRCTAVSVTDEGETPADDAAGELAAAFLKTVSSGDAAQLLRWCVQNEGIDTQAMAAFLDALRRLLADALCGRRKAKLSPSDMLRLCELADRCTQYLKVNTNVKQLFGLLAVDALPEGERKQGNHN